MKYPDPCIHVFNIHEGQHISADIPPEISCPCTCVEEYTRGSIYFS